MKNKVFFLGKPDLLGFLKLREAKNQIEQLLISKYTSKIYPLNSYMSQLYIFLASQSFWFFLRVRLKYEMALLYVCTKLFKFC